MNFFDSSQLQIGFNKATKNIANTRGIKTELAQIIPPIATAVAIIYNSVSRLMKSLMVAMNICFVFIQAIKVSGFKGMPSICYSIIINFILYIK